MAKKVLVKPKDIGILVGFIAYSLCGPKATAKKKKPEDIYTDMQSAVMLGLLLAKRQPDLVEAATQLWIDYKTHDPDEALDGILTEYQKAKQKLDTEE